MREVVALVSTVVVVPIDAVTVASDLAFSVQLSAGLTSPAPPPLNPVPAVAAFADSSNWAVYASILVALDAIERGLQVPCSHWSTRLENEATIFLWG